MQEIIVCQIQPGQYRKLHSLVKDVGSIELLALIVTDQGEAQAALDNRQPASQQQHTEPSTVRQESPSEDLFLLIFKPIQEITDPITRNSYFMHIVTGTVQGVVLQLKRLEAVFEECRYQMC